MWTVRFLEKFPLFTFYNKKEILFINVSVFGMLGDFKWSNFKQEFFLLLFYSVHVYFDSEKFILVNEKEFKNITSN